MNTPAATIVAAWISALTGVGPSIASGSQVWSGTWADLANAPTSSRMQPATRSPSVVTNALMPAAVAVVRRYQNEIRKYDAAPTNAQPTISSTKLAARTSSSM